VNLSSYLTHQTTDNHTLAFLRLPFSDPLLCLTASMTLRDRPLLSNKNALTHMLDDHPSVLQFITSKTEGKRGEVDTEVIRGFAEVNLLEGLKAGTSFPTSSIVLPSTRLGQAFRSDMFSLQPSRDGTSTSITPITANTPTTATNAPITMRKSHRRTLHTVSGFRVRMRSVFVPSVLLSDLTKDASLSREEREAAADERSVVLCVEVENSGDAGPRVGFQVDKIDVHISGDGASTTLVDWAQGQVFPLRVGAKEQFNLLYAVSFFRSPQELESLSTLHNGNVMPGAELHRAVTITIHGKPYTYESLNPSDDVKYATGVFTSKWNVMLNLSSRRPQPLNFDNSGASGGRPEVFPEPASPFPFSVTTGTHSLRSAPMVMPRSGLGLRGLGLESHKRHTLPSADAGDDRRLHFNRSSLPPPPPGMGSYPRPTSTSSSPRPPFMRERTTSSSSLRPTSLIPPSIALAPPRTPTTYDIPNTPAYPAYPPGPPEQQYSPAPFQHQDPQAFVGPTVDVRRQKAMSFNVPPTPGPILSFESSETSGISDRLHQRQPTLPRQPHAPDIVVSVGLILREEDFEEEYVELMDDFWLDVFVYNKSEGVRRFELSCPDGYRKRRRRNDGPYGPPPPTEANDEEWEPGVVPMENAIRVGYVKHLLLFQRTRQLIQFWLQSSSTECLPIGSYEI
jgi:hypothetical protein